MRTSDRVKLRARFDEVCEEIRGTPGYQDFPSGISDHDVLAAAKYGPIVVINVPMEPDGVCDAILISCEHQISTSS